MDVRTLYGHGTARFPADHSTYEWGLCCWLVGPGGPCMRFVAAAGRTQREDRAAGGGGPAAILTDTDTIFLP